MKILLMEVGFGESIVDICFVLICRFDTQDASGGHRNSGVRLIANADKERNREKRMRW